jgi:hypothetical protein
MEEKYLEAKIDIINNILEILHNHTDNKKNDYESFRLELWDMYFKLNDKLEYLEYKKSKK